MGQVQILWYLLEDEKGVGLRKQGTTKIFSFTQDRKIRTVSVPSKGNWRILGTYVGGDGSYSLQTLAQRWMEEQATGERGEQAGLVKTVAFGNHLESERHLRFEWNKRSLDILKARVDRLPLDIMEDQRQKDYSKLQDALERAKEVNKGVKVASEAVNEKKSSIERLNYRIAAKSSKITENEKKYDNEAYGAHRAHGKKGHVFKNGTK